MRFRTLKVKHYVSGGILSLSLNQIPFSFLFWTLSMTLPVPASSYIYFFIFNGFIFIQILIVDNHQIYLKYRTNFTFSTAMYPYLFVEFC